MTIVLYFVAKEKFWSFDRYVLIVCRFDRYRSTVMSIQKMNTVPVTGDKVRTCRGRDVEDVADSPASGWLHAVQCGATHQRHRRRFLPSAAAAITTSQRQSLAVRTLGSTRLRNTQRCAGNVQQDNDCRNRLRSVYYVYQCLVNLREEFADQVLWNKGI